MKTYQTPQNTQHNIHIETYGEQDCNHSDGSMGYYDSDIDLSDLLESDNYTTIRASDQHTDTSSRRKIYTKTRAPTPHKPQPIFAHRYSLGR